MRREAEGVGLTAVEAEGAGGAGVSLNPNAVQGTDNLQWPEYSLRVSGRDTAKLKKRIS